MSEAQGGCSLSVNDERHDDGELLPPHPPSVQEATSPAKTTIAHDYLSGILGGALRDVESCDLLCSLFVSALTHYRRDTVLRPFPSTYLQSSPTADCDGGSDDVDAKRFQHLERVMKEVPPLPFVAQQSRINNWSGIMSNECSELLLWILDTRSFTIKAANKNTFSKIKELTGQVAEASEPSYVFEVIHSPEAEDKFLCERNGRDSIYAYHGSRVENFHSILHNGLCNHMNKNSLFGEGTYLSSELSVCMPYSPTGQGWNRSILGDKMSCVAVCEIISHANVKCHTRDPKKQTTTLKALNDNLSGDNIPEKYYIVRNDELVRVKYLLVFVDASKRLTSNRCMSSSHRGAGWFTNYKLVFLMMAYLFVLVAIGLSNSRPLKLFLRKYLW